MRPRSTPFSKAIPFASFTATFFVASINSYASRSAAFEPDYTGSLPLANSQFHGVTRHVWNDAHRGQDTPRAREIARIMNDVAPTKVTTNLWGESLVQAGRQLHGQPDLGPLRLRLRRGPGPTACRGASPSSPRPR